MVTAFLSAFLLAVFGYVAVELYRGAWDQLVEIFAKDLLTAYMVQRLDEFAMRLDHLNRTEVRRPFMTTTQETEQELIRERMERLADVALFLEDPHLAMELGYEPPKCFVCGGQILSPPRDWDGVFAVKHLFPTIAGCESKTTGRKAVP